jgi:hypothetical protein
LRNIVTRILNSYLLMLLLLVQARRDVTFLVWSLKPNVLNRWYAPEGLRAYFLCLSFKPQRSLYVPHSGHFMYRQV